MLALLVRRKWWVVAPFLAMSSAIAILVYFLPKTYVSESLILVRPRDIPADMVKDLIPGSTEQRLKSIEQTVLSRTNLLEILRQFSDRLPEFRPLNLDDQVTKLHSQINIAFDLDKSVGPASLSYFRLSYQSRDPQLAKDITSKLTGLFIEQDNRDRETHVNGTTDFFDTELQKVADQLKASETRLREVKSQRLFELPSQLESNYRTLDRLTQDKKTNAEALDRYVTFLQNLQSELAAQPEFLPRPATTIAAQAVAANPQLEEYRKAKAEYDDLSGKFKPLHPDVQAARARLERLQNQIPSDVLASLNNPAPVVKKDDSNAGASNGMLPNPLYQSLLSRLNDAKTEYAIRERNLKAADSEILKYQQRVESTPQTEQDIAEVTRQNEDLKKQYDELKGKLGQASLAESLESKQKGSQFQVIDPANLPLAPAKPNKRVVLLGGCIASLFVAIGLAVLVDVSRQKIWTQAQIEAFWGVPVLVDIPEILTDSDQLNLRKQRRTFAVSSVAGAVAYGFCLYLIYLKHGFLLEQLDPVIQKLVYR